jgi:hypothetical protein
VRTTLLRTVCKWALRAQVVATVTAVGLAVAALVSPSTDVSESGSTVIAGAAVSTPLLILCIVLLAGGGLGVVALRHGTRVSRLRAAIVLMAPAALTIWSIFETSSEAEPIPGGQYLGGDEVTRSISRTLALLTWAHRLAFLAVLLAAASAVLVLLYGRKISQSPSPS